MKKFALSLLLVASVAGLAACAGDGSKYPAPYSHERTAGGERSVNSGEPVFEKQMTK